MPDKPYYEPDLAMVHHLGYGFHADMCAPGVLALLEPYKGGTVLEIGCGSGLLTRYLVDAGHKVIATDASDAMLAIASDYAARAMDFHRLALPDDPIPEVDAIVSIGHPISYLDTEEEIWRALTNIGKAARFFAIDICDLEWGSFRKDQSIHARAADDWAIITRFSQPPPNKYVREMTTFLRNDDDSWRRSDERHDNVLVDTSRIPTLLEPHGATATVETSFGSEELPVGLKVVIGRQSR
jgi:SAM-dependent methyltransferase